MREVVIVAAKRTPIGSFGGAFKEIDAARLGEVCARGALDSIGLDPQSVDMLVLGNALQAGLGQNLARQVAIRAGMRPQASSFVVNMVCGSGLKAVELAAQTIMLGNADIVAAGGSENMSRAPYLLHNNRFGQKMGSGVLVDSMIHDGLTDAFHNYHMGVTAENLAEKYGITREEQDEFASQSQQKAIKAMEDKTFADELTFVNIPQRKGEALIIDQDEYPRAGVTAQSLAKLRPAFKDGGSVTAGNSSGINDGAAMVILMSKDKARSLGLKPMASIESCASAGVLPEFMGTGPIPSTKAALAKAKLTIDDIDLVEANEAFAVQALVVTRELGLNMRKVNVNGGAIALGHPIGASGARALVSLVHELQRRKLTHGLATLCIGGGQGISMIIRRAE